MGANVRELIEEGGAVRGVRYEDGDGRMARAAGDADGRGRRAHFARPPPDRDGAGQDLAADGRALVPPAAHGFGRRRAWRAASASGDLLVLLDRGEEWQVGYVIPKGSYQRLRAAGLEELRRRVAGLAPALADRIHLMKEWKQVTLLSVESSCLERWHRPGLLLIGDAAHVMSPVAGVGINYAIQDAVVAANVLAGPLLAGEVRGKDLRAVERRRRLPTRVIQTFQSLIQRRLIAETFGATKAVSPPAFLRFALPRRLAARFIAFGIWPVHVKGRS